MNANPSPSSSPGKRAILPRAAALIQRLLRMFWLAWLALLGVTVYGLIKGWSTPRQWSDAFFIAAAVQLIVAWINFIGSNREAEDSAVVRYLPKGNVTETLGALAEDSVRRETFGLRAFIGGLVTLLAALIALWM